MKKPPGHAARAPATSSRRPAHPGLRVGVDARPLAFPATGNATYLFQMLRQLLRLRPDDEWLLYSHRPPHPTLRAELEAHPRVRLCVDESWTARAGPLWTHLRLPGLVRAASCDVFWGSLAMLPLGWRARTGVPALVNFHDLNSRVAPGTMPLWKRLQHRLLDGRTLRAATRVACLSETTRADIRRVFPELPADHLHVVYPGVEGTGARPTRPARLPVPRGYILCVGTLEPRKNQATLLAAYLREPALARPLVFAGRRGWDEALYRRLSSGELERQQVYYLEHVSDGELVYLYQHAAVLAFPSVHEGFGLPVIEAYQHGCPAILSDIPIFREIGGAARFVGPHDVNAWRQALEETARPQRGQASGTPGRRSRTQREFWSWNERARVLSELLTKTADEKKNSPAPSGV